MKSEAELVSYHAALIQTYAITAETSGGDVSPKVLAGVSAACAHFQICPGAIPEDCLRVFGEELHALVDAIHPVQVRSKAVFALALAFLPQAV